jgi:hypothetical protein
MRIGLENVSVAVRSWPSKDDFDRYMKQATNSLDLDVQIEYEKAFFSLVLQSEPDGKELWTVGIRSEDHGILPEAIVLPKTQQLLIGADSQVHFLSWATKRLTRAVPLGFLFRSFIVQRERSLVLAVHETGLAAFSLDGSPLWKLTRDVIETIRVDGDRLEISFMDEGPITVAIDSGHEVYA